MLNYAIAAAVLYTLPLTIADGLSKKNVLKIGGFRTGILMMSIGLVPAIAIALLIGLGVYSTYSAFLAVITGVLFSLGYLFFYKTIETEQISNSIALSELGSVIFVIFGFIVFGEAISSVGIVGVVVVFLGAVMISITEERKFNRRLLPAMIAFIFWALGFISFAYSIKSAGTFGMPLIVSRVATLICFIIVARYIGFKKNTSKIKSIRGVATIGFLDAIGISGFGVVTMLQSIGLAGVINTLVPGIGVIMGYLLYKERLTKLQMTGFAIMIMGAILVSAT